MVKNFIFLMHCFRVVNVSSTVSSWVGAKSSDTLKARFAKPDLTMSDVEQLMNDFVRYIILYLRNFSNFDLSITQAFFKIVVKCIDGKK